MNEMVERVARAIFMSAHPTLGWETTMDLVHDNYRDRARAAIEAMREPTEAMLEAASGSIARWAWPAMIDAALADHD